MRPLVKKQPGESVQYTDSRGNIVNHVVQADYEDYGDAKLPLIGNIDRYCSYCESLREIDALEIEHRVARHNGGTTSCFVAKYAIQSSQHKMLAMISTGHIRTILFLTSSMRKMDVSR